MRPVSRSSPVSGGAYAAAAGTPQVTPKPAADHAAEQKAFLDDVAKRLNVTRDQLDAAVKGAAEARIDAAVADGKLTQEQGEAAKKRLANGVPMLGGPILGGKAARSGRAGFRRASWVRFRLRLRGRGRATSA